MFQDKIIIDTDTTSVASLQAADLHIDSNGSGELTLIFKANLFELSHEDIAYLEDYLSKVVDNTARDNNQRLTKSIFFGTDEDHPYHEPQFSDEDDFDLLQFGGYDLRY